MKQLQEEAVVMSRMRHPNLVSFMVRTSSCCACAALRSARHDGTPADVSTNCQRPRSLCHCRCNAGAVHAAALHLDRRVAACVYGKQCRHCVLCAL